MIIHQLTISQKAVAFTFDDGPNPLYTPQVLDIFKDARGKATFYMIGEQIEKYPDIAKSVHTEGHEIGNHTYSHPYLTKLSEEERMDELLRTQKLIKAITGAESRTFRPPYLDCNEQVERAAASFGYPVIGAVNGEARDWEQPGVQHIIDVTLKTLQPGSILLFHDGYGDRSQTIAAVSMLVQKLSAEGYELVSVSELLQMSTP
ncbi:polysaccharide deacetylase family protein [Paenibacillus aestuarii]|uniref:Polysaccharide deacetylase family protein n=1 Tax=Paenibacillus aestuarii TaxID=516965 RepID=A0ABW0KEF9_9BACL|nr:polysaccharide deacetylase family protein [Paenibacillus aestuarii]